MWGGRERIPYWEGREDRRGGGGPAHLWRRWRGSLVDRRLQASRGSAPHPHAAWLAELSVFLLRSPGQGPVVQGSGQ